MAITVFVANLPFDWDEHAIRKHFTSSVHILKVDIVKDPNTKKSHGAALLSVNTEEDAQNLIDNFDRKVAAGKRMLSLRKA